MVSSHPCSSQSETAAMRLLPNPTLFKRLPVGRRAWIVPFTALALFVAAILVLLWFVHRHETEIQLANLRRDTQYAELAITREILAHQEFADRLAGGIASGQSPGSMIEQARAYQALNSEIRNVIWSSADDMHGWSIPSWKDLTAIARERSSVEERERMRRLAIATGRPTYTEPYRDSQDEPYIEYFSPVVDHGSYRGSISMTLSLRTVMQRLVPVAVAEKYRLSLVDAEGRELFSHDTGLETSDWLTQSVSLTLPWRNLVLSATSYKTDSLLGRTLLTGVILIITCVLAWSLWSLRRRVELQAQADSALMASHERFVTVLDAIDSGVAVSDMQTRELLFCNESFSRIFPGHGIGSNGAEVERAFSPLPSQAIPPDLLVDIEGNPAHAQRIEVRDEKSGHWYALRVRAVRWVDGRLVRLTMISDITDRKAAEERSRVQQEKLLLTSRLMSVGEMASTLAHEINQPLSAIANYNMGAVRRLKSDHWKKEDLVSALEKSAAQAERAGRVVHRVREFLRRREPVREPMSINEVVVDVTELIELEAEKSNVQLRLDMGHDVPLVSGDRIMIEQLLLNLIKNGIEAMKQTRVQDRILTVQTATSGGQVEIRVMDRGHGIAADVAPELFSPFFTTKDNGMGMGLNICRSIVELHDGHLWFSANPAGGSVFHFTLPPAIEPATQS
jgi:two-component system sensor histidine kinase DctS